LLGIGLFCAIFDESLPFVVETCDCRRRRTGRRDRRARSGRCRDRRPPAGPCRVPRNKPCGGGISLRILKRFPALERELPRIATHTVSRLHLEGPGGESTVIESDGPAALMIRRVEFDALLVSLAVEAGAELVSGADIVQAREHADGVIVSNA